MTHSVFSGDKDLSCKYTVKHWKAVLLERFTSSSVASEPCNDSRHEVGRSGFPTRHLYLRRTLSSEKTEYVKAERRKSHENGEAVKTIQATTSTTKSHVVASAESFYSHTCSWPSQAHRKKGRKERKGTLHFNAADRNPSPKGCSSRVWVACLASEI